MTRGQSTGSLGLGIAGGAAVAAWWVDPEQTMRAVEWAWNFLLQVLERSPANLWTVVLAVLSGWLAMLRVSRLRLRWLTPSSHTHVTHLAGAAASFTVVWILWREPLGLIVGALIGFSAPFSWALALILLEVCPGAWSRKWAAELRGEGRQLELFRSRK